MADLRSGDKVRLAPDFLRMHDILRTVRGGEPLYVYEVREEGDTKVIVLTPLPPPPKPDRKIEALSVEVAEEIHTSDSVG